MLFSSGQKSGFADHLEETFTHDPGGRLRAVSRAYFFGARPVCNSAYTYFANGKLKLRIDVDGTHDYAYDARGLLASITITPTSGPAEGTYTFDYDALGRNNRLTFPDGHERVQGYDLEGRITSRCYTYSDASKTRCYTADSDPVGNPTRMIDPEGTDVIE